MERVRVPEAEGAKFLERDFNQCFQQMRHYDAQIVEIVKFGFTAYGAIAGAALALYRYGLDKGIDFRPAALAIVLVGLPLGLTLLALATRNRSYFVLVTRYVNEHRHLFLNGEPLGFENGTGMYVDRERPAYFHWTSSQSLLLGTLAILNSGLLGLGLYVAFVAHPSKWAIVGIGPAVAFVTQLVITVRHLRFHDREPQAPNRATGRPAMTIRAPSPNADDAAGQPGDEGTARFLCDLAVKRHDLADRAYDALNTRLATVFAFNSFLIPSSISALRPPVSPPPGYARGWPFWAVAAVWGISLIVVTAATVIGVRARSVHSLPDAMKLDRDFGAQSPGAAARQVIRTLDDAWNGITAATSKKALCLNVAVVAVAVELAALIVLVVLW